MKKIIALLLACVLVIGLAACGNTGAKGKVYYLNFKPEADAAWQALAAEYTKLTGVEVVVKTAASGTYSDTLTADMAKTDAPTLFQCGNAQGPADWGEYCLDLADTKFAKELTTNDFNLYDENGALKAVGYCYEAFGIIVNKALLAQAGYSVADIKDYASLKAIADDIHARADELGFDAFSAPGLEGSSSWRFSGHLANMPLYYEFAKNNVTEQPATITGEYMYAFKNIWDLYITDTAADPTSLSTGTGEQSTSEFKQGKAVFYQNGTWEYAGLIEAGMTDDQLAMIPIYCGAEDDANSALCSGTENRWAVNAKASEADQKASIDFLVWLVSDPDASKVYVEQLGAVPFKNAPASANKFVNDGNAMLADGKSSISWAFNYTPNVDSFRATLVTALASYSAGGDWSEVVTAFVDGWAIEYATVNG